MICQIARAPDSIRSRARDSPARRPDAADALFDACSRARARSSSRSTSGRRASRAWARRMAASSSRSPSSSTSSTASRREAGAERARIFPSSSRPASAARSPPTRSFAIPTGGRRIATARCACIPTTRSGWRCRRRTRAAHDAARQRGGLGRDLRPHAARTHLAAERARPRFPGCGRRAVATGVSPNELTRSEDRDWVAGTPWHKHTPARVEAL